MGSYELKRLWADYNPLYPPYFKGEGGGNNAYFEDCPLRTR
jgi:hypothetical protein